MQFREPNKGENFSQIEERILNLWGGDSSIEKSLNSRKALELVKQGYKPSEIEKMVLT